MTDVEGVLFPDGIAEIVKEVCSEARRLTGSDSIYMVAMPEIRACIRPRGLGKKARGVYIRIRPTAKGADILRGGIPKSGMANRTLTKADLPNLFADMAVWVKETQRIVPSIEVEFLESKLFVSGGMIESNRSKH